jgi:glutathione S-transferase
LTKAIRELEQLYLSRKPFMGGDRPSHVDFYLMAQLRTRGGCGLFVNYLQEGIGGEFWRWWVRMSNLCQYSPDRITTL